jgi:hypothetical protein
VSSVDLAARIRSFELERERRCATRIEPTAFGTAYLNLDFPLRYDSNFVWVERTPGGLEADALAADADRVLGEHGLAHRKLVVDDEPGARLAPAFRTLGWSAERDVVMVLRREPEPRPAAGVRELGFDRVRPVLEAVLRRQPFARRSGSSRRSALTSSARWTLGSSSPRPTGAPRACASSTRSTPSRRSRT